MQTKTQTVILRLLLLLCVLFALSYLYAEQNGSFGFFESVSAVDTEEGEVTTSAQSRKNAPSARLRSEDTFARVEKLLTPLRTLFSKTASSCRTLIEKRMQCTGYCDTFVAALTEEEQAEARAFYDEGFVFYRQTWSTLNDLPYGDNGNTFGECGCGPTVVATVISNLAGVPYTPVDARLWAYENGGFIRSSGATTYQYMFSLPEQYGIKARRTSDKNEVYEALQNGALVLVCVGKGDFTFGSHFMLYRGVTENGDILIADSYSYSTSSKPWTWERLSKQVTQGYYIYETE